MKNKSLGPEQNDALRALAREVVERDFDGVVSRAAAAPPKIAHSMLFEFLQGQRGAGIKVIRWLSARTGRRLGELIGETDHLVPQGSTDPYPNRAAVLALFAEEYDPEAVREVRALDLEEMGDRPRSYWIERLQHEHRTIQLKRGAHGGRRTPPPSTGGERR